MINKIKGALLYDGSGAEPILADLELKDGHIAGITQGSAEVTGEEVLDASGLVVTPGFIDIHRHHDVAALYDPTFGQLELAQGITTAVAGNCGLSPFPNAPASRAEQFSYIEPCLGKMPEGAVPELFSDYMATLAARPLPLSVGALVGAGACATAAMGYERRSFTSAEREKAVWYVQNAMESGALGLSFGIMYTPECYLSREDQVAMAKVVGQYGGMVSCHIRGEGNSLVESVEEIIGICEEAGVPLNISHFKVTGVRNWGRSIEKAIEKIEAARARGQQVAVDAYPYTGGATTILSLIPPCVTEGKDLSYLGTPEGVQALKDAIFKEYSGWDNMVNSIGWERIIIGSVTKEHNRVYCGKNIAQIAKELGLDDPCDWVAPFVAEEEGKVGCVIMSMSQEDVDRVLSLPYAAVISDSLYGGGDNPHPRLYGSFPKVIREYVMERGVMTLQQAIRKMTAMPAERVGLKDRGYLRPGYVADLNIFDPHEIRDKATFENSKQLAGGIRYTLIDGQIAAENGKMADGLYGKLVRR